MKYALDFRTYSNALKNNNLMGLKCRACGSVTCPPRLACQDCASTDLDVVNLSGNGTIKTYTTTHIAPLGREVEAPYTIVMVELAEGPWISGNLIDIDPNQVDMHIIGRKVRLGHKVFPGDVYASGEAARPLFSFT